MKLVYYSTAYFATHGGSSHSKHFFLESQRHPLITDVSIFPKHAGAHGALAAKGGSMRSWIRKISLMQIPLFYRRNKFHQENLIRTIQEEKPDAVIIRLDSNFLQIKNLRELFPSLVIATEVNASPFDESFRNIAFRFYFRALERKHLMLASCNFFVSDNLRRKIMGKSCDPSRDFVVHNGVDTTEFKPMEDSDEIRMELGLTRDNLVLGYIGTLDSHKHVDVLIHAFSRVPTKYPQARLVIIGDGHERAALEVLAKQLNIQSYVIFAGWRAHQRIPFYLNSFEIAIHHLANDYMSPLKLFEYMACRLPVIGPATHAVQEVFTDRKHLVVTTGSVDDLFQKMEMLLADEAMRRQLAEGGYKLVSEKFTWATNADFIISRMADKLKI